MAHIFISYATRDRPIADEIASWLREAGHEPFLAHDVRNGIGAGENWLQRLYQELRRAKAVIAVVTEDLKKSLWCSIELGIADSRGCLIVPLRAEGDVEHPLMQDLQYVDYHADPRQARKRVLDKVRRRLLNSRADWQEGDNPFPGLEPFISSQSLIFFGRDEDILKVTEKLRAMRSTGEILVIAGRSGCGKSSLLNAGVGPSLGNDEAMKHGYSFLRWYQEPSHC